MIQLIRRFLDSKVGWTLCGLHFLAVLFSFWGTVSIEGNCRPFPFGASWVVLAGRPIHLYAEPAMLQFLLTADLPALLLAESVSKLLGADSLCYIPYSWLIALLGFLLASGQWFLIGKSFAGVLKLASQ